jgi:hypothetical protein
MKAWIRIAMLVTLTVWGTSAPSAQESKPTVDQSKPAVGVAAADDNMTPYRKLAGDTLTAFKAHDLPAAKKKARELEAAWDSHEKALQKKSPDLWGKSTRRWTRSSNLFRRSRLTPPEYKQRTTRSSPNSNSRSRASQNQSGDVRSA